MSERKTCNLTELAFVLDRAESMIKKDMRANPDFPVISVGANGVEYVFDVDENVAWYKARADKALEKDEARQEELILWRSEVYPGSEVEQERMTMTPQERKAEADAVRMEDYNRAQRGELVERKALKALLTRAVDELQAGLMQLPVEVSKRLVLSREHRIILEEAVRRRMTKLRQRLTDPATWGPDSGRNDKAA